MAEKEESWEARKDRIRQELLSLKSVLMNFNMARINGLSPIQDGVDEEGLFFCLYE